MKSLNEDFPVVEGVPDLVLTAKDLKWKLDQVLESIE